jgi:hypothetical protein
VFSLTHHSKRPDYSLTILGIVKLFIKCYNIHMARSGILVHGRHLNTPNWSRLVWGDPEQQRMGSLPTMVDLILREASDQPVEAIIFGTGASRTPDGIVEADFSKQYLLDHFNDLEKFNRIKQNPKLHTIAGRDKLEARLRSSITETTSKNTREEIIAAAGIFKARGITVVSHVTAASHAPRCVQLQSEISESGQIPKAQRWSVVADDMTFRDLPASATTILEPWHRGDTDPTITASDAAPIETVMKGYFGLSPDAQLELTANIAEFIAQNRQDS